MKPESKLWKLIKKNTPQIQWTRLESWSSFGVPDLLGYHENSRMSGFFMLEMKVTRGKKIHFSPHQKLFHLTRPKRNFIIVQDVSLGSIKLYESSALPELLGDYKGSRPVACNDWDHIQRLLIRAPLDAWELERFCTLSLARHPPGGSFSLLSLVTNFFSVVWPGPGERSSAAVAACSLIAWAPLLRLRNSLKNFGCLNVWVINACHMIYFLYLYSSNFSSCHTCRRCPERCRSWIHRLRLSRYAASSWLVPGQSLYLRTWSPGWRVLCQDISLSTLRASASSAWLKAITCTP